MYDVTGDLQLPVVVLTALGVTAYLEPRLSYGSVRGMPQVAGRGGYISC